MKQGRYFRQKPKELLGTKYDSTLELIAHEVLKEQGVDPEFHPAPIPYIMERTYEPDFLVTVGDTLVVYIEAKGYFQDASETQKYRWVRESLAEGQEIVFLFENPKTKLHYLAKRKDGTKMTMAEWADKNKFRWFTIDTLKELFTTEEAL